MDNNESKDSQKPLTLKDQTYIRVFEDGNVCKLVFYVNEYNVLAAKADFKITPPNWPAIITEYEQWVLDIAVEYQNYIDSVYPPKLN